MAQIIFFNTKVSVLWSLFSGFIGSFVVLTPILILINRAIYDVNYVPTVNDIEHDDQYYSGMISGKSEHLNEDLMNQKNYYKNQANARWQSMANAETFPALLATYIPQMWCPNTIKVGHLLDGSYYVCNPNILSKIKEDECVIFSLGVSGQIALEKDLYEFSQRRCKIYCVDEDNENPNIFVPFDGRFMKARVTKTMDVSKNRYTMMDIAQKFKIDNSIEILKVDVEGSEFDVLPKFLRSFKGKICQLLIEMHSNYYGGKTESIAEVQAWARLFRLLEKRGFYLFARNPNPFAPDGVYIYSYIHFDCLKKYDINTDAIFLTHFA